MYQQYPQQNNPNQQYQNQPYPNQPYQNQPYQNQPYNPVPSQFDGNVSPNQMAYGMNQGNFFQYQRSSE